MNLAKVILPSGAHAIYEAKGNAGAEMIRYYGRHHATRFAAGWQIRNSLQGWKNAIPEEVAHFEALPITY